MENTPEVRFVGFTDVLPDGQASDRQVGNNWYTYVLLCENGTLYKGKTNNLERRIQEHLSGSGAKYTKCNRPIRLVHVESFATEKEAVKREQYFKSSAGRAWLKKNVDLEKGYDLEVNL